MSMYKDISVIPLYIDFVRIYDGVVMKEHPILFSAPMVNAILEGRKTMTRRVVKHVYQFSGAPKSWKPYDCESGFGFESEDEFVKCPFGKPGSKLWVRETFVWNPDLSNTDNCKSPEYCFYRADGEIGDQLEDPDGFQGWKPSIFMPRWASRITLEITGIRVERLQDITEDDALAEGVNGNEGPYDQKTPKMCFETLWDKINGKKFPWQSNPWVWVIEFKRIWR